MRRNFIVNEGFRIRHGGGGAGSRRVVAHGGSTMLCLDGGVWYMVSGSGCSGGFSSVARSRRVARCSPFHDGIRRGIREKFLPGGLRHKI